MNKNLALLTVGAFFLLFACEPSQKQIANKLEQEIIDKHDEAMAKMNKIQKTIKALEKLKHTYMVDSLNHEHHLAKLEDCNQAIADLEEADKAMMKWMHEFKIPEEDTPVEEKIKYFKKEKEKIIQVNENIEIGIHEGMHFVRRFYDDLADEHKHEMEKDSVEENKEKPENNSEEGTDENSDEPSTEEENEDVQV